MAKRPLILALNPSIDAEWTLDEIRAEEKNEVLAERRWPGGKGINVARWLRHLDVPAVLLLPLGGNTGREMRRTLRAEGLAPRVVPVSPPTRVNVIVTPARGPQFRFNPVWSRWRPSDRRRLDQAIRAALPRASWIVLSGSLPRGLPADTYARVIQQARRAGVPAILDCEGPALERALAARPFLVKPNELELAQWAGLSVSTLDETSLLAAARAMAARTGGWVLVSCAGRGAWLVRVQPAVTLAAAPPAVTVRNSVGAGDALLAAVVREVARGAAPEDWLRWGVAAGTAAVECPAGVVPARARLRQLAVQLHPRTAGPFPATDAPDRNCSRNLQVALTRLRSRGCALGGAFP